MLPPSQPVLISASTATTPSVRTISGLTSASAIAVLILALQLLPFWGAVVAALFFAVHPVHVEAVALAVTGKVQDWSVQKGAIWWLESRGRDEAIVRAVVAPDLI